MPFPVAIGGCNGFQKFFEAQGSLTNGSFSKEFAALFSSKILERSVLVIEMEKFLKVFLSRQQKSS